MTIADHPQFSADFQHAFSLREELDSYLITNGVLLMERGIA